MGIRFSSNFSRFSIKWAKALCKLSGKVSWKKQKIADIMDELSDNDKIIENELSITIEWINSGFHYQPVWNQ